MHTHTHTHWYMHIVSTAVPTHLFCLSLVVAGIKHRVYTVCESLNLVPRLSLLSQGNKAIKNHHCVATVFDLIEAHLPVIQEVAD